MRLFACFFIVLAFSGCKKTSAVIPFALSSTTAPEPAILPADSVSYLALGDSYTYGLAVSQNESFPFQLDSALKQNGYKAANPVVIARFGWTSADLLAGVTAADLTQKFDFVTLLIGVNDQNKGVNTETFTSNLDQLIGQAVVLAKGNSNRVFVISIPDWSVTPFAANMNTAEISAGVQLFNTVNQVEAGKFKVNYIDISALSDLAATDPSLTSYDGLHPSAKMYALWANQFYGNIIASFKQ
jgi:lysophospholipase L1-like esterase